MKIDNNRGIVYVLTNSAMPGLVKIGMTTRDSIDAMMKELYSTGVPKLKRPCILLWDRIGLMRIESFLVLNRSKRQPYLSSLIGKTLRARLVLKSKMI